MTKRVNLAVDSSLQSGTTAAYSALNGAALTYSTEYNFYGAGSLRVTKSANNNSGFTTLAPIPVVANKPYAASVYVRLPQTLPATENANLVIRVEWRNSVNAVVSTSTSAVLQLDDDDNWSRIGGVWVAPVGATVAYIQIVQLIGGTAGAIFYADAILFEQSNFIGGYFNNFTQAEKTAIANKALAAPKQVVNGLQLNADVVLNDLVFNTIDEYGNIWICTGLDGWWGQSEPDSPDIPRGTEDGSYDVSGRYQARLMTLTGVVYPPNAEGLGAARDALVTATNLVRKGGWLRTMEDPTRAAFVRLSGRPQIVTTNDRGRTEFSIGLKAGDPIKYHWNDADPDGFTHVFFGADALFGTATNIGTSEVTAVFTITGPMGAGSAIYNVATDETLTFIQPLRGAGAIGAVTKASVTSGIATLTTSANHHLIEGDEINIVGVGSPYDSSSTGFVVLAASTVFPYTFSYAISSDDLTETTVNGQVQLRNNDTLVVDTYERSVTYNGSNVGQRSKLKTLTDWIKIAPGTNLIEFADDVSPVTIKSKQIVGGVATLTSTEPHYLITGESVVVALNEIATLSKKSLTGNVATLTTVDPHGFSVSDKVDVSSVSSSIINNKTATTTAATITTVDTHGVSATDVIVVNLPASAAPANKVLTGNVATITTQNAHGFSAGDSVTVALAALANIVNKALTSNQAILTTSTSHNFQVNDSITVVLPTTATITAKAKAGAQAVLTTSANHGFVVGDSVTVAMPASAALANSRASAGSAGGYLVTLNTSAAHGFEVGDQIAVNIGLTTTKTVTNRSSSTTTRTLTSAAHGFSVGERITVSGVSANYNGSFYITAVTTNTFSYTAASFTEASTASSGSVLNNTWSSSYNGNKVIETVPTSTSFTFLAYDQDVATSSTTAGTGATLTNTTNVAFNGTKILISASGTQFTYNF
jgi:hypothetical protein